MNALETQPIKVALSPADHQKAMAFAKQQPNPQHGQQIYLNVLAMQAVHHYLEWFGIASDPTQGDSAQVIEQWTSKIADLVIPEIGKLECCPVLPHQTAVLLPSDILDERIGYIAVQFSEQLENVDLRGFLPFSANMASLEIPLSEFQPMETVFDRLVPVASTSSVAAAMTQGATAVSNLSRWLQNFVEPGWQTLEELLSQGTVELAYGRSLTMPPAVTATEDTGLTISRFRTVDFGLRINHQPLILMINVTPIAATERQILVRVMPGGPQTYLPEGLNLKVLNEVEVPIENLEVVAQADYDLIQLTFTGDMNETFNLQLNLDTETFQLPFVI
jgi:hypothetical protein